MSAPHGLFGNPGEMGAFAPSARSTPGYQPTPNSEPMGSITGVPVRTRLYSVPLLANMAVVVVQGTRENKVAFITPPDIGYTVFVGEAGVSVLTGQPLLPGQVNQIFLPGFQEVYAVSNAPVTLRLGIQVAPILLAERERRL